MHSLCTKQKSVPLGSIGGLNFGCRMNKTKASTEIPASAPAVAPELQVERWYKEANQGAGTVVAPSISRAEGTVLGQHLLSIPRAPCAAAVSLWGWIGNICLLKSPGFSREEPPLASPGCLCPPEKRLHARAVPLMSAAAVTAMISCQWWKTAPWAPLMGDNGTTERWLW